jgi:predicted DNA-binding protein (UPF0251 family)
MKDGGFLKYRDETRKEPQMPNQSSTEPALLRVDELEAIRRRNSKSTRRNEIRKTSINQCYIDRDLLLSHAAALQTRLDEAEQETMYHYSRRGTQRDEEFRNGIRASLNALRADGYSEHNQFFKSILLLLD